MTTMQVRPEIHIDQVVRNAIVFGSRARSGGVVNTDSLLQAVNQLFALLDARRIDYVLVGGIALLQYVEGRNTEDLDLIVAVSSLQQLPEIQIASQDQDFARGKLGELQIDLLLTSNPLFDQVRQQHVMIQHFADRDLPCATVEGLLLLKLYALPSLYRLGNFARVGLYENDIATLMQLYRPDMAQLLAELAHYLSESDLASLREILTEIDERLKRFGKAAKTTQ
jgi:hypothetical protein